jgi:general secretion pathway protein L
MSRTRLILLPPVAGDPAPWLSLDVDGQVLARGQIGPGDPVPVGEMRTVVVVPGSEVTVRRVQVAARTEAQARAAALLSLREGLAEEADRLVLALSPGAPDAPRLAAVAARSAVEGWRDWVRTLGLEADVLLPDSLVVAEPETEGTVTAVRFGPRMALRGQDLCASVEPELVPLVVGDREVVPIERPEAVERLLIAAALTPPLNLIAGPGRETAGGLVRWRLPLALAAALAVSPLLVLAAEGWRDAAAARGLEAETRAMAEGLFQDLPPGADPAAEARRRAGELPPPGGVAAAAAALFGAMEGVSTADLDALVSDAGGTLRATLTYAEPSDLERIKAGMAARGYGLTEETVEPREGGFVADLILGGAA